MYKVELNVYHRENTMPCVDVKELRESIRNIPEGGGHAFEHGFKRVHLEDQPCLTA